MKKIVYGEDRRLADWAGAKIGMGMGFGPNARAIGIIDDSEGHVFAVTVWDYFTRWNCIISVASDGSKQWMTPGFLFRSFAYPFLQLGLQRVTNLINEGNSSSLSLSKRLGFIFEGRMRKSTANQDDIVLGLLREECRWIADDFKRHAETDHVIVGPCDMEIR